MPEIGRIGAIARSTALAAVSDSRHPSRPELVRTASDDRAILLENA